MNIKMPSINIKNKMLKKIIGWKLDALVIYAIVFVIAEVLISGGLYERGVYFGIIHSIFVLALVLLWQSRRKIENMKNQIYKGAIMALVFAGLDFLLIDLFLERFNHNIYSFWGTYAAYAIILLIPVLYLIAPAYLKKMKSDKVEKA